MSAWPRTDGVRPCFVWTGVISAPSRVPLTPECQTQPSVDRLSPPSDSSRSMPRTGEATPRSRRNAMVAGSSLLATPPPVTSARVAPVWPRSPPPGPPTPQPPAITQETESLAETHGNRTHRRQGYYRPPVLKTGPGTSTGSASVPRLPSTDHGRAALVGAPHRRNPARYDRDRTHASNGIGAPTSGSLSFQAVYT